MALPRTPFRIITPPIFAHRCFAFHYTHVRSRFTTFHSHFTPFGSISLRLKTPFHFAFSFRFIFIPYPFSLPLHSLIPFKHLNSLDLGGVLSRQHTVFSRALSFTLLYASHVLLQSAQIHSQSQAIDFEFD